MLTISDVRTGMSTKPLSVAKVLAAGESKLPAVEPAYERDDRAGSGSRSSSIPPLRLLGSVNAWGRGEECASKKAGGCFTASRSITTFYRYTLGTQPPTTSIISNPTSTPGGGRERGPRKLRATLTINHRTPFHLNNLLIY